MKNIGNPASSTKSGPGRINKISLAGHHRDMRCDIQRFWWTQVSCYCQSGVVVVKVLNTYFRGKYIKCGLGNRLRESDEED